MPWVILSRVQISYQECCVLVRRLGPIKGCALLGLEGRVVRSPPVFTMTGLRLRRCWRCVDLLVIHPCYHVGCHVARDVSKAASFKLLPLFLTSVAGSVTEYLVIYFRLRFLSVLDYRLLKWTTPVEFRMTHYRLLFFQFTPSFIINSVESDTDFSCTRLSLTPLPDPNLVTIILIRCTSWGTSPS